MEWIAGIDEAGRGPLAGPVAVGVVYAQATLDLLDLFPGLNDSKRLSPRKREAVFEKLNQKGNKAGISFSVVFRSAADIDKRGITVVIREAIAEGLETLEVPYTHGKVYLDGSLKAPGTYSQETIIKGDSLVPAIMLASIAAKVTRDRLMTELHSEYPEYGFAAHKGYGTRTHADALKKYGSCPIHRATFVHLDQKDK